MNNSNILMYTTEDGVTKVEVTLENDTVWLSIDQMAQLFMRDRSVIGKHVRNIFKEGELEKNLVWAKFAYTASDGKKYDVDFYNLDVIISVGYRYMRQVLTTILMLRNQLYFSNRYKTKCIGQRISIQQQKLSILERMQNKKTWD